MVAIGGRLVWVTWTISLQYFPDCLLPPKWGLQKAVFETICGAVAPRATNLWIVELGAAEGSQRAGVLSSMVLHYCALQSWKHRADESGFSESWWFKRSNKKEVRDGAQCGGQECGGVATP